MSTITKQDLQREFELFCRNMNKCIGYNNGDLWLNHDTGGYYIVEVGVGEDPVFGNKRRSCKEMYHTLDFSNRKHMYENRSKLKDDSEILLNRIYHE